MSNNKKNSNSSSYDQYDAIIDINSIRFLNKGWNIIYKEKEKNTKEILNSSQKYIVSMLGHSNRGKTYILNKLSNINLQSGYQIQTKGISIKIPEEQNIIILDTQGTNAPLLLEENEEDKRNQPDFQKDLEYINLCQIITNYIIQTFIIKEAKILICVIGMLTSSETIFLNKIKKNCRNIKQLIVIHNLIKCYTKKDIEEYKEGTLMKNIIFKFEERIIPSFDPKGKEDKFNKYYIEIEENNNNQSDILHFFFGNDSEKSEVIKYNEETIKYIQDKIDIQLNEEINLFQKLTEHINSLSSEVLAKNIKVEINGKLDLIKCNEEIEPKEIIADELDNIIFIKNYFEPNYKYWRKENKFIIGVDICSKLKENSLKVIHFSDKENNDYQIFKIKGERELCEQENKDIKVKYNFINKRISDSKFLLKIKINLSEKGITAISGKYTKIEINKGSLLIYFDIIG